MPSSPNSSTGGQSRSSGGEEAKADIENFGVLCQLFTRDSGLGMYREEEGRQDTTNNTRRRRRTNTGEERRKAMFEDGLGSGGIFEFSLYVAKTFLVNKTEKRRGELDLRYELIVIR